MKKDHYFHRVNEQTQTRFWINNVTKQEAVWAIEEGATGCTQNPAYVWKMINHPEMKEYVDEVICEACKTEKDNHKVLLHVQRTLVAEIAKIFLPLYEASDKKAGYVSIQGNPFCEDCETMVASAEFNASILPNMMAKIPVTKEGLKAIEIVASKGIPINATEVLSVSQAIAVCESYKKATAGLKNKAPIYFSHITGIFDEYLQKYVKENHIAIHNDTLQQAGIIAAKKTYEMAKECNKEVGFIGGGARKLEHFTEMVGGDVNITINWKGTAEELIKNDAPVIQRFFMPSTHRAIDELCEKLEDFRKGYFSYALQPEEYEDFGPVVLFRSGFEKAWSDAVSYIETIRSK